MKIGVLYGGVSGEREVSISSSKGIISALESRGYAVYPVDFHPERLSEIIDLDVDLVYIALHGKYGEDGRVQSLLDMLGIPYIGSNVLASALAMDKSKAKEVFSLHGIPVAKSKVYTYTQALDLSLLAEEIKEEFELPFIIKPNSEGSTLGLSIINKEEEIKDALIHAFESDHKVLVETYLDGMELTVPVLGELGHEKALPVIEIVIENDLYDYEAKYSTGGSEHVIPARISEDKTKEIQSLAIKAHKALGCEVYSRADFILTKDGTPYILEVNTLPGMTETSLFPDACRVEGIAYDEMIERFIQITLKNKEMKI